MLFGPRSSSRASPEFAIFPNLLRDCNHSFYLLDVYYSPMFIECKVLCSDAKDIMISNKTGSVAS